MLLCISDHSFEGNPTVIARNIVGIEGKVCYFGNRLADNFLQLVKTLLGIFKMLFGSTISFHKDANNNNYLTRNMIEGKNLVIKCPYRSRECKFSWRWFKQILYLTYRIV